MRLSIGHARSAAIGLAIATVALEGAAFALGGGSLGHRSGADRSLRVADVLQLVSLLCTTAVGLTIALRRPRNPVGWIFSAAALSSGITYATAGYAIRAVLVSPGSLPGPEWAVVLHNVTNNPAAALALLAFLLFPTGRLASSRWRPALVLPPLAALGLAAQAFVPGPMRFLNLPNPLGIEGVPQGIEAPAGGIPLAIGILVAFVQLVRRFRAAGGAERQQIKWLALPLIALAVAMTVTFSNTVFGLSLDSDTISAFWGIAIFVLPISMGIAIIRYRLYDIDILINRALVYGGTTAGIAASFFAGIVALQSILRPFTNGSELAVAASTLLSFALFQPLRRRVQRAVDRRFYRSRYDATRTLNAFSIRLRDEVDLDAVRGGLLEAVRDTVQPAHAGVWLRAR